MKTSVSTGWWRRFFTESVYPLAEVVDSRSTALEVRELARTLPGGSEVLDVACGIGRHAVPLSRKGYRVTGVDYSASYLAEARRRGRKAGAGALFLRRDMRDLGFEGCFDAALNLWTSFGYFPRIQDDRATLASMYQALRPGGTLYLEVLDPERLAEGLPERHWERLGRYWLLERPFLRGGKDPALIADRWYVGPKGTRGGRTFVRLYSKSRLRTELARAGFTSIRIGPGLLDRALGVRPSRRLLAQARRPAGG